MVSAQRLLGCATGCAAHLAPLRPCRGDMRAAPRGARPGVACAAHKITLLPGDGIGPEIADVAVRLLRAAGEREGEEFEVREELIGGAAVDAMGRPLPDETLRACRESDAVLLAAIGGCARCGGAAAARAPGAPRRAGARGRAGTSGTRWRRS